MQLIQVLPDKVEAAWPHLQGFMPAVVESARGKIEAEDIQALCKQGMMQLWAAIDEDGSPKAIALTEIAQYPRQKIGRVTACIGRDMDQWLHLLSGIEAWAKEQGCSSMQHIARKGYAKKLHDYKLTHVLLERAL